MSQDVNQGVKYAIRLGYIIQAGHCAFILGDLYLRWLRYLRLALVNTSDHLALAILVRLIYVRQYGSLNAYSKELW